MSFFSGLALLLIVSLVYLSGGDYLPLSPARLERLELLPLFEVSLASLIGSWLVVFLILRFDHLHQSMSHDNHLHAIQKIHDHPVPRVGGVPIMGGLLFGLLALLIDVPQHGIGRPYLALLLLSSLPVFLGGFMEDVTKEVRVRTRLVLAFLSSVMGAYLLHAQVPSLGLPGLDAMLTNTPFFLVFTVFAVGGVTHGFNLIDGLNGLLGGFTLILLTGFLAVAYRVGDYSLFMLGLFVMMAALGFLLWNWPRGLIFAGDGGAYLLGYVCATLMVLLVARNPEVSPWYPMVALGYPVFETLFSVYRRWRYHNAPHDAPDDMHMHQLIFRLIKRLRGGASAAQISSNSLSALPIWVAVASVTLLAVKYAGETHVLMGIFLVGAVAYKILYRTLYFYVHRVKLGESSTKS